MDNEHDPEDGDLPLHDEAKARGKWRGGETLIGEGEDSGLPASEVDHARLVSGGSVEDASPQKSGPVTNSPPDFA